MTHGITPLYAEHRGEVTLNYSTVVNHRSTVEGVFDVAAVETGIAGQTRCGKRVTLLIERCWA